MITRDVLFWMWLGGVAAFSLRAFDTPEFRAHLHRTQHLVDQGRAAGSRGVWIAMPTIYALGVAVSLIWPLMLLARMTIGGWLHRVVVSKKYEFVKVHCSVCGLADEASVPLDSVAWTSIPNDWLINSQLELTCSPNCAKHLDHCPAHDQSNIKLH